MGEKGREDRGEGQSQNKSFRELAERLLWRPEVFGFVRRVGNIHVPVRNSPSPRIVPGPQIFEVRKDPDSYPYLVYDHERRLSGLETEFPIKFIEKDEDLGLSELCRRFPDLRREVMRVAERWGWTPPKGSDEPWNSAIDYLKENGLLFKPIPRLRDPSALREIDWGRIAEGIVDFQGGVDPRVKRWREAVFLRGVKPQVEPNSLVALPPAMGKSAFFEKAGRHVGKATANGLMGFAKSGREIYPGALDGVDLPFAIDQIEEQSAWQIGRYLFDYLEVGRVKITTGGVSFTVQGKPVMNFLANPGISETNEKSFAFLLSKLSDNPALGRRFGLIYYFRDGEPIGRKLSPREEEEWKALIEIGRAVEEFARESIEEIYEDPRVWEWLNEPMDAWKEQALAAISGMEDKLISGFLKAYVASGVPRLRNAALRAAIFRRLKDVALGTVDVEELLALAEDLLPDYLDDVLESLRNIAEAWQEERGLAIRAAFEALPKTIKEIVSACEHARRAGFVGVGEEIDVLTLGQHYQPAGYDYLSQAVKILRRGNPERHNARLQRFFGIQLRRVDKSFHVVFIRAEPIPELEPLGSWRDGGLGSVGEPQPPLSSGDVQNVQNVQNVQGGEGLAQFGQFGQFGQRSKTGVPQGPDPKLTKARHFAKLAWEIWRENKLSPKADGELRQALTALWEVLYPNAEADEAGIFLLFAKLRSVGEQGGLEGIDRWLRERVGVRA